MNTIVKAIMLSTAMSFSAFAGGNHSDGNSSSNTGSMGGGMMTDQNQMTNMRLNFQQNQNLMEQIRNEEDANKRNELLQKHMNSMQEQMQSMNNLMEGGSQDHMSAEEMPEQIEMMNKRMNMMQMMMKQMMQHQDLTD